MFQGDHVDCIPLFERFDDAASVSLALGSLRLAETAAADEVAAAAAAIAAATDGM